MGWANGVFSRLITGGWATDKTTTPKITAARHDQNDDDLATGINACIPADGSKAMTANLPMGGKKVTGMAAGTATGDAVEFDQMNTAIEDAVEGATPSLTGYVKRDGSAGMTAALPMGANKITGLANGTAATDAATIGQIGTPSDGSVTEAKIGTGAVTAGKIGAGAVTADKIGAGIITGAKMSDCQFGYASTTAAGSTSSDAAQLPSVRTHLVSSGGGTKGVLLPASMPVGTALFFLQAMSGFKIYPPAGETIDGGSSYTSDGVYVLYVVKTSSSTWVRSSLH